MDTLDLDILKIANGILRRIPGTKIITSVQEIDSALFVAMYEGLFAEKLPDVILAPVTKAEEAHNIQAVIDTLSLDILNTSLSHLSGEAIVAGDKAAIKSLLEVFKWLFEYILERIGNDSLSSIHEDDPDVVRPEIINSILQRELRVNFAKGTKGNVSLDTTAELAALADTSRGSRATSRGSPDKTADLIALGQTPPTRDVPGSGQHSADRLFSKPGEIASPIKYSYSQKARAQKDLRGPPSGRDSFSSLSTGPVSPEPSKLTSSGFKTTAELLRESEELQRRFGSLKKQQTAGSADASVSSSTSYPKAMTADEIRNNTEFHDLGARPLSERPAYDSVPGGGISGPQGHQYHSVTHHLYHHYDPVTNVLDPATQSRPIDRKARQPKVTRDTQVTPGRFMTSQTTKSDTQPVARPSALKNSRDRVTGSPASSRPSTARDVTGPSASSKSAKPKQTNRPLSASAQLANIGKSTLPKAQSKSSTYSYDNLRQLIEETMSMSQDALEKSPLRKSGSGKRTDDLGSKLAESLNKLTSIGAPSQSFERLNDDKPARKPSKQAGSSRKVSFQTVRPQPAPTLSASPSPGRRKSSDRDVDVTSPKKRSLTQKTSSSMMSAIRKPYSSPVLSPTGHTGAYSDRSKSGPRVRSAPQPRTVVEKYISPENRDAVLEELYRRLMEKRRREQTTARPQSAASSKRGASVDSDEPYMSDGVVDYGRDDSYTGDIQAEIEAYRRNLLGRGRRQEFDDALDDATPGEIGGVRRQMRREDKGVRVRSEFLKDKYEQNLADCDEDMQDTLARLKQVSRRISREYNKKMFKPRGVGDRFSPAKKYKVSSSVLWPKTHVMRKMHQRNSSRRTSTSSPRVLSLSSVGAGPKSSRSASSKSPRSRGVPRVPPLGRVHSNELYDSDILPFLLKEFPYLNMSSEGLYKMWRQGARQLSYLSGQEAAALKGRKNKQKQAIEQAESRFQTLTDMAKKEVELSKRMREHEERRKQAQNVRSALRDKRMQHARVRKYYDEYAVRMRSKMLKKRTKEEVLFKKLFEDGLKLQRERLHDLRQYVKDQQSERSKRNKQKLDAMEHNYRDRFALLSEAVQQEKAFRVAKAKAQKQAMEVMSREFRKQTEKEIEMIQDAIFAEDDDIHFRRMDAERLMKELRLASYKADIK